MTCQFALDMSPAAFHSYESDLKFKPDKWRDDGNRVSLWRRAATATSPSPRTRGRTRGKQRARSDGTPACIAASAVRSGTEHPAAVRPHRLRRAVAGKTAPPFPRPVRQWSRHRRKGLPRCEARAPVSTPPTGAPGAPLRLAPLRRTVTVASLL